MYVCVCVCVILTIDTQRLIANRPRPEGTSDDAEKARNEAFKDD